jgi:hypothetical protein
MPARAASGAPLPLRGDLGAPDRGGSGRRLLSAQLISAAADECQMDRLTSPDADEWPSSEAASAPTVGDDVLDRETIDTIEELHSAVVRAEAEQRFGMVRGRRPRPPVEAQAAEYAFLAMHGFATYNDFRLRIRRSTARPVPTIESGPRDERNLLPADRGVLPAKPDASGQMTDQAEPSRLAVTGLQAESGDAAGAEFLRRIRPLLAAFQADADELIASRVEDVERQSAEIVDRASDEAAEIVGRATRAADAVTALVMDAAGQSEHLLAVTEVVPTHIGNLREQTTAVLEALAHLAVNGSAPSGTDAP